ncbi:hypothetical protein [Naasia lichenicola]|uniref:Right handed beta helix domain-containing protein n=1 Tax=Naasia lichenicola TaxID=2565933 RepID=A0A4S4FK15_9MICO|nr:hypothetical protein [Naasia lichenicola]THG30763.1 hypothetical protein E6C64_08985 [Naasia lichenicola]THG32000.1 hypothetical protein E6C64_08130 [Naasia lichenicola]
MANRPIALSMSRHPYRVAASVPLILLTAVTFTVSAQPAIATPSSAESPSIVLASSKQPLSIDREITAEIAGHFADLRAIEKAERDAADAAHAAYLAAQAAAKLAAEQAAAAAAAAEVAAAEAAAQAETAATASAGYSGSGSSSSGSSGSSNGSSGNAGSGGIGVPSGVSLSVVSGDVTVTQAGTVLDSLDIHGRVIVKAPNVTIRNSIVRGTDSGGKYGLIDAMGGYANLQVIDTEIAASNPNWSVNGIMGSNFELHGVNIHNTVDQVSIAGSNVVIANSWLHGGLWFADDPDHSDGSHSDNIEMTGGSNVTITGNTLDGGSNAAIQITQDRSTVSNLTISDNQIGGGDCSINISEKGKGAIQGLSILGNLFGLNTSIGHCAIVGPSSTPINASGNAFVDGLVAAVKEG